MGKILVGLIGKRRIEAVVPVGVEFDADVLVHPDAFARIRAKMLLIPSISLLVNPRRSC